MAKATAKCTCVMCGIKFFKYADKYNRKEANDWEAWAEEYFDECNDCYQARIAREREEQNREAAEVAALNHWPTLIGTEKQVKWANTIRAETVSKLNGRIARFEEYLKEANESYDEKLRAECEEELELVPKVIEYMMSQNKASWWIDNRRDIISLPFGGIEDIVESKLFIIMPAEIDALSR